MVTYWYMLWGISEAIWVVVQHWFIPHRIGSSLQYTVEVEMFALKNVCDFSNPANMKFFANKLFAIFYSV